MRRGNLIMAAAAVAMVVAALLVQRWDVATGKAQYWQHEQEPAEDELPQEESAGLKGESDLCTHLPIVRIQTDGQKIPGKAMIDASGTRTGYETGNNGEEEIPVTFSTVEDQGVWHHASDASSVEGTAMFRVRGHSSRAFSKSSYLLSLTNGYGSADDKRLSLLGMPAGTKWALHGPFLDKTLIRNYLCLNLCGEVMDGWVPQTRFCELMLDGKYQGVYVLIEMIEIQPNRLNLQEYNDGDVAPSYLTRIEPDTGSAKNIPTFMEYTYRMEPDHTMELEYPGPTNQVDRVRDYVSADISEVERMLYANDIDEWMDEVDLQDFVDYYLMEEFMAINDTFSASTYFYRDVRGRVNIGPVWDFNNAFNNFFQEQPTREFLLSQRGWFGPLMRSDEYVERVVSRWRELRRGVLSDESLRSYVYGTQSWLGTAIERNYEVWGYSFDPTKLSESEIRMPDVGSDQTIADLNPSTYDEASEWMVNYMLNRARWMDENINSLRQYCHPSRNV